MTAPGLSCGAWDLWSSLQHGMWDPAPWPGTRPLHLGAQSLSHQAEREVPHKFLMVGFIVEKREKTDFQIWVWCATARMKLQELRRRGREMLTSETVGRAFWVLRLCPQLSPQPLRTWVYRLPLGWGQVLSEKLHSEDTVFNYIVRQPIDIIWNLQQTLDLKGNRICFGEKEPRSAESNYLIPLTSCTLKKWKNLFLLMNKTSQKGRIWLRWRDCQTFRD